LNQVVELHAVAFRDSRGDVHGQSGPGRLLTVRAALCIAMRSAVGLAVVAVVLATIALARGAALATGVTAAAKAAQLP
jgi:hypothetical protein